MPKHLLRPLLIVEFLLALEVLFTAWSEIGGQYHLDLMFWPWKLGIGFGSAWLITMITANLVHSEGQVTAKVVVYCSLLFLVCATAGVVTWYYHLHEPADQDEDDEETVTPAVWSQAQACAASPGAAGLAVAHHREAFLTAEGLLEFRHVRHHAVDAVTRR